jgi:hypothetical protein
MLVYGVMSPYSTPSDNTFARFSSGLEPDPRSRRMYSEAQRRGTSAVVTLFSTMMG